MKKEARFIILKLFAIVLLVSVTPAFPILAVIDLGTILTKFVSPIVIIV